MRYSAFISYSHTEDEALAIVLERALERIAMPWYRPGGRHVFRDDSELAADPSLWGSIQEALDASKYLVVLLSPAAARSPWVDREIAYWLKTKSAERLVLVITAWDGEERGLGGLGDFDWAGPDVPPALRGAFADEPRPVDVRFAESHYDLTLRDPRFRDAVAQVAAPMLGRPKSELVGEHVRQRRRFRRALTATIAVVGVAMTLTAVSFRQAIERGRMSSSRQLAAQARDVLPLQHDVALLLSVEAFALHPTPEARAALGTSLARHPEVRRYLHAAVGGGSELASSVDLTAVAMSPGGNAVVAGTRAGRVIVWDSADDWTPRRLVPTWEGAIAALAFAPIGGGDADGLSAPPVVDDRQGQAGSRRLVVMAGSPPEVTVLDISSGQELWRRSDLLPGSVSGQLAFAGSGRALALGGLAGRLVVVNPETGEELHETLGAHPNGVTSLAVNAEGSLLASGGWDGAVHVWELGSGREIGRMLPVGRLSEGERDGIPWQANEDPEPVLGLAFSPDGQLLQSFTEGGLTVLWDVQTGGRLGEVSGPAASTFLGMGSDGRTFAFEDEHALVVWDARAGVEQRLEGLHESRIMKAGFAQRARRMVTVGGSRATLVDLDRLRSLASVTRGPLTPPPASRVHLSPDGSLLAYADAEGALHVRSAMTDSVLLGPLRGHEQIVNDVAFAPDGAHMASAADDGWVMVWDLPSGERRLQLEAHPHGSTAVAFSPDGLALVAAGAVNEGTAFIPSTGEVVHGGEPQWQVLEWDASSGERRGGALPVPGAAPVWDLAFSPDGRVLAVGSGETTTLWRVATHEALSDPIAQAGLTKSLAFGGGDLVASAAGGSVQVVDVTGREASTLVEAPFSGVLNAVALSADGQTVAFAGDDGGVYLWDVAYGALLGPRLALNDHAYDALSFRDAGRSLVAAGAGGVVVWDLDPQSWLRRACQLANRRITRAEWQQYLGAVGAYWPSCREKFREETGEDGQGEAFLDSAASEPRLR